MEKRIIELLEGIFEQQKPEKQSEILTELLRVSPLENTEITWKIGAGYSEESKEIGLSFSPILSHAQSIQTATFPQIMEAYLSKSKEIELAEILCRLLGFLEDVQPNTIRVYCIPSGFVGEKGIAHFRLAATPTAQAEQERKARKEEQRQIIQKLAHETGYM